MASKKPPLDLSNDKLLTIQQAAKMVGLHWKTFKRHLDDGRVRHYRLPSYGTGKRGTVRIPVSALEEFVQSQKEEGTK